MRKEEKGVFTYEKQAYSIQYMPDFALPTFHQNKFGDIPYVGLKTTVMVVFYNRKCGHSSLTIIRPVFYRTDDGRFQLSVMKRGRKFASVYDLVQYYKVILHFMLSFIEAYFWFYSRWEIFFKNKITKIA